jgi:hypothetical protein
VAFPFFKKLFCYAKDKKLGKTETKNTAVGVQQTEMADARMGILYFLGNTDAKRKIAFDFGVVSSFVGGTSGFQMLAKQSLWIAKKVPGVEDNMQAVKDDVKDFGTRLKEPFKPLAAWLLPIVEKIKDFFRKFKEWLQKIYGSILDVVEGIGEFFVWASATFSRTLADAIPGWGIVTAASDVYAGVCKAVDGAIRWYQQVTSGRGVELLGGHPALIANALLRHSQAMILGGAKDTAIGGTKMGLEIATVASAGTGVGAGISVATKIISIVFDILTRIAKLIDQTIQRVLVKRFLARAKSEWTIKGSNKCIVNNHDEFTTWFSNAIVVTPIIAALVLGSGFAGHPMRFLQLLDNSGNIVTQAQFDQGVKHIDMLKTLAGKYAQSYVDDYRTEFTSTDALVRARLHEIITGEGIKHVIT